MNNLSSDEITSVETNTINQAEHCEKQGLEIASMLRTYVAAQHGQAQHGNNH
jgi:hypothetical protein